MNRWLAGETSKITSTSFTSTARVTPRTRNFICVSEILQHVRIVLYLHTVNSLVAAERSFLKTCFHCFCYWDK